MVSAPNWNSSKTFKDEEEAVNYATAVNGWMETSFDEDSDITIYTIFYINEECLL